MAVNAYIGAITLFAGKNPPPNYFSCTGVTTQISLFPELFSLIGSTYGGDGRDTFALPNLKGRAVMGHGMYPVGLSAGVTARDLFEPHLPVHNHEASGETEEMIVNAEIRATSTMDTDARFNAETTLHVSSAEANVHTPAAGLRIGSANSPVYVDSAANVQLGKDMVSTTVKMTTPPAITTKVQTTVKVDSQPITVKVSPNITTRSFSIEQSVQVINFFICIQGIYPPATGTNNEPSDQIDGLTPESNVQ